MTETPYQRRLIRTLDADWNGMMQADKHGITRGRTFIDDDDIVCEYASSRGRVNVYLRDGECDILTCLMGQTPLPDSEWDENVSDSDVIEELHRRLARIATS